MEMPKDLKEKILKEDLESSRKEQLEAQQREKEMSKGNRKQRRIAAAKLRKQS